MALVGNIVSGAFHAGSREALQALLGRGFAGDRVDRIQRNFDPLRAQVNAWRSRQLTDEQAKLVLYRAFIEGDLSVPRSFARDVHRNYFKPTHAELSPRTMWSLTNAFTSALKSLDLIPFFQATATLGPFLSNN